MCYECHETDIDPSSGQLPVVIDGVLKSLAFAQREEVKAWEQEFVPCEHTLTLVQEEGQEIPPQGN